MCWAPPLSPGDMQARQPVLASLGGTSQTGSHLLLHEPTAPVLCSGAAVGLRAEARETLAHPLPDRPLQASLPHGALQGGWGSCPVMSNSCDPMDCSTPSSSVHGVLQARILEWVTISFSRGSFQPKDQTQVFFIVGRFFIL